MSNRDISTLPGQWKFPASTTTEYHAGESVIVDYGYPTECIAKVVDQSPARLYTIVESEGVQWEVMTYRLEPIHRKK